MKSRSYKIMRVVIVGTGVSALLLAQALVRVNSCRRVTLIGPKRRLHPHFLSYWSDTPTPFDAFVEADWSTLCVNAKENQVRAQLSRFKYRTFRAQRWAEHVLLELLESGKVEIIHESVGSIEDDLSQPRVRFGTQHHSADWVFVSNEGKSSPAFWQRFMGWELELPGGSHIDTKAMTLLDFRTPAENDMRFVYVLPLSSTRLFVEHVSYQNCDHDLALRAYLADVLKIN